jgi:hypothetical protein
MTLVPLFDLKFLTNYRQVVEELQIGGTGAASDASAELDVAAGEMWGISCKG